MTKRTVLVLGGDKRMIFWQTYLLKSITHISAIMNR